MFYVFGDYGYDSECELEVFETRDRAIQFIKGYTKFGDMGGYNQIEAAYFTPDGEYVSFYRVDADDFGFSKDWEDDNALVDEF
jgi:hypothetical protein